MCVGMLIVETGIIIGDGRIIIVHQGYKIIVVAIVVVIVVVRGYHRGDSCIIIHNITID